MKFRKIAVLLSVAAMIFVFGITVNAAPVPGTPVGYYYATDITAYVNGVPIRSFNIGGKTVVIVEDLENYNFKVVWDNYSRTLTAGYVGSTYIKSPYPQVKYVYLPYTGQGYLRAGDIAGIIYATDIITVFEHQVIPSYNIGGYTAVAIEDLADAYYPYGPANPYSPYETLYGVAKYEAKWDGKRRTIELIPREESSASTIRYKMNLENGCACKFVLPAGWIMDSTKIYDSNGNHVGFVGAQNIYTDKGYYVIYKRDYGIGADLTLAIRKDTISQSAADVIRESMKFEASSVQTAKKKLHIGILKEYKNSQYYSTEGEYVAEDYAVLLQQTKGTLNSNQRFILIKSDGSERSIDGYAFPYSSELCRITETSFNPTSNILYFTRYRSDTRIYEYYRMKLPDGEPEMYQSRQG